MSFKSYLQEHYRESTVKAYTRRLSQFLEVLPGADKASYKAIVEAFGFLRKTYPEARTLSGILIAVKKYYQYLIDTGRRTDHPCRTLRLRDSKNKEILLQDLFTPKELESLLDRKERYKNVRLKNQVLLTLLIYQGLTTSELTGLQVQDVDLEAGSIKVTTTTRTTGRTLPLKSSQVMLFYRYLHEERPGLLKKRKKKATDKLLLSWRGNPEKGEGISYLIGQYKHLFPGRNLNPVTIRQSVIANQLKAGRDIREVQAFAGHKYASTTEKYKPRETEEFKAVIEKLHPLG